jgi:hypothetical protein
MVKIAVVSSLIAAAEAGTGHMSVLGGSVVGGKCEYANPANGGAGSPAATSPHVVSGRYCGVSEKMFAGGASCGACYKVSYSGEGGTNPGKAGSAVVQVVNQASEVFACHKDVFQTITGATTGIFPITYTEVPCEVESVVGVATVLDGNNAYYTKAIFSDLPHAVSSARLKIGKKSFPMNRAGGATFSANTDGTLASASFELTLADGSINTLASCFKSWPVATASWCAPKAVKARDTRRRAVKARASRRRANPCPAGGCPDRGTVGETCAANAAPCLTSSQPKPCCTPYKDNAAGWTIMDTCYEKTPGFNVCRKAGTCKGDGWSCKVIHGLAISNTTVV